MEVEKRFIKLHQKKMESLLQERNLEESISVNPNFLVSNWYSMV